MIDCATKIRPCAATGCKTEVFVFRFPAEIKGFLKFTAAKLNKRITFLFNE